MIADRTSKPDSKYFKIIIDDVPKTLKNIVHLGRKLTTCLQTISIDASCWIIGTIWVCASNIIQLQTIHCNLCCGNRQTVHPFLPAHTGAKQTKTCTAEPMLWASQPPAKEVRPSPVFRSGRARTNNRSRAGIQTVDGRNPAPVNSWFIPSFTRFQSSKVVQDVFSPP